MAPDYCPDCGARCYRAWLGTNVPIRLDPLPVADYDVYIIRSGIAHKALDRFDRELYEKRGKPPPYGFKAHRCRSDAEVDAIRERSGQVPLGAPDPATGRPLAELNPELAERISYARRRFAGVTAHLTSALDMDRAPEEL